MCGAGGGDFEVGEAGVRCVYVEIINVDLLNMRKITVDLYHLNVEFPN